MSKIVISLILNLLVVNSLFAIEKNASHSFLDEKDVASSLEVGPMEIGISISLEIENSSFCYPSNGLAEITAITKDGVIEDISNFEITWFDYFQNAIFSGPSLGDLEPGRYFVSAIHIESRVESDRIEFYIQDISMAPIVSLSIMNANTSCDVSNPTGVIRAFVHEPSSYSEVGFKWFKGTSNNHEELLMYDSPILSQVPAGQYTVEAVDYITGCATLLTIYLPEEITLPQINVRVKNTTGCTSDGELEITEITEWGNIQEFNDYNFNLYDSEYAPIGNGSALFTQLSAGTYYMSATEVYTQCASELVEVSIINVYDTSDPSSDFTVVGPNPDLSRCGSGPMTLEAQGAEHFRWYNSSLGGDLLAEGATYTIENLQETRPIWVSVYDPTCSLESERKEFSLKVVSLPLITSLVSDVEQATLSADINGVIKWYLNEEIIEGENENTIVAHKDGVYSIEVSNSDCKETKSISFNGLSFSKPENIITAPQIPNSSYQWLLNGIMLEQEASHTLAVSKNGKYSVKIHYENESDISNGTQTLEYTIDVTTFETITGLGSQKEDQKIKIYPIPFENAITLEFSQDIGESLTLRLWDMNGKIIIDRKTLVLKDKKITVDIPGLGKGVYVLEAVSSEVSHRGKIIK